MAASAGILHPMSATQSSAVVKPMDASSDGAGSSDSSATISANDFLTLLVTEMQNQDPTADTDPNEYINQLVNVNSLEQLIDINQTLSTAMGGTGTSATGGVAHAGTVAQTQGPITPSSAVTAAPKDARLSPPAIFEGNLSAPAINQDAQRVAHSLGGQKH